MPILSLIRYFEQNDFTRPIGIEELDLRISLVGETTFRVSAAVTAQKNARNMVLGGK